jgi:4'-phosphopantetheinyl transferase
LALACDVDVWLISLESGGETVLSPDEEIRAARFRFESDRTHWIRARSALRLILSHSTGIPPGQIRFSLGPHGKPALADERGDTAIEFSLSHAGTWAMVAVTRGVPVGIDIERIRDNVNMAALLQRLGESLPDTQTSLSLFNAWTRREAMSKAVGGALLDAPTADLRTCHLDAPEGYSAALALVGQNPRIRRQDALVLPFGTV